MGDQQEMPTLAEIGWLTGIIEGEGSITMNVRKKTWKGWEGVGVDLAIQIVNTDAGITEKAQTILQKMGIQANISERQKVRVMRANGKDYSVAGTILCVGIHRMVSILAVLRTILPHMAGEKAARARLIEQFIVRRLERKGENTKNGPSWYDGYDWKLVRDFYDLSGGKLLPEVEQLSSETNMPGTWKSEDRARTVGKPAEGMQ